MTGGGCWYHAGVDAAFSARIRRLAVETARRLAWVLPMAAAVGCAGAFFLWSLEQVTLLRFAHPWLLYLLPVAGVAMAWLYHHHGGAAGGGNLLIVEQIHEPGGGVPRRMAPLILLATLVTHLCGGSAGREGTAVQMGGSLASAFARWFRVTPRDLRIMLMAGVAAGFGAVFGTPWAAAVFALEVVKFRNTGPAAAGICVAAALTGNLVCSALGVTHHHDTISPAGGDWIAAAGLLPKVVLAAVLFGTCGAVFVRCCHGSERLFTRLCPDPRWRPAIGAAVIIGLVHLLGTREFLGLGMLPEKAGDLTLPELFRRPVDFTAAFWKAAFTVATLSSGFRGGEVTPLFFIGAAFGNALSGWMGGPPDLFAALGFAGVFAAAARTPLACTVLGMELFGASHAGWFLLVCLVASFCGSRAGLYHPKPRTTEN